MRNIFNLFFRYSAFIVFVIFEIIALYLIVNYNKSQKEIWAHSSNLFTGTINKYVQGVEDFFALQATNDSLLIENANLLQTIIDYRVTSKDNAFQDYEDKDSTNNYTLIPSRICSKTLNLRNNYLTLCKGSSSGIEVGMGVITFNGIVGIVKSVSKNYSTVLMVLNSESRISAKVATKNYIGNLVWSGSDLRELNMMDVPKHSEIAVGDSILTSGYSISFPPEIFIGVVESYTIEGGSNNYNIKVQMKSDLSTTDYVYVVNFLQAEEKEEILSENE